MKARNFDYKIIGFGAVVTRSEHWNKIRYVKPGERKQLGIITEFKYFQDGLSPSGVVCWPSVHWEGNTHSSLTHPANVKLFRKDLEKKIKWIEMEA